MDFDEIKNSVVEYMEAQSRLLPSQKVLKELGFLLSNSKRYCDYCLELREIFENNVETISLAGLFFGDCSAVFYQHSILKIAILLDNNPNTVNIEKFLSILNSTDAKRINKSISDINNKITIDRANLEKIRHDFKAFKNKRDKEIAHFDKININENNFVYLDVNSLIDIQSRIYDLIKNYFRLLDLPDPSCLTDYESIGVLTGLEALNSVIIRGLKELDFSDNERIQKIIKSSEILKIIKETSN